MSIRLLSFSLNDLDKEYERPAKLLSSSQAKGLVAHSGFKLDSRFPTMVGEAHFSKLEVLRTGNMTQVETASCKM